MRRPRTVREEAERRERQYTERVLDDVRYRYVKGYALSRAEFEFLEAHDPGYMAWFQRRVVRGTR